MIRFPESPPVTTWSHTLRSRYAETDKMGYVYYGRYLEYFEEARTEMIRRLGLPYSRMEEEGILLPVVEAALEYKAPVFYDEQMEISVSIHDLPQVRLVTWYRVLTARRREPHVLGRVTLAFLDRETRRPRRAPDDFLGRLEAGRG